MTDLTREQIEARIETLQDHRNKFPKSAAFIFELEVLRLALQAPQFQPAPPTKLMGMDVKVSDGLSGNEFFIQPSQPPPPSDVVENKVWNEAIEAAALITDDVDQDIAYSGTSANFVARQDALKLAATAIRALKQ